MQMNKKYIFLFLVTIILISLVAMLSLEIYANQNETDQTIGDNRPDENELNEQEVYEGEENSVDSKEIDNLEEEQQKSEVAPIWYEGSDFELPVVGAGGYTSVLTSLYGSPTKEADIILELPIGTAFEILEEQENWWRIETAEYTGWINNTLAMINLPDVLPSIIYDNPNNYASEFRSSFIDIPGVTGKVLYNGLEKNDRLGYEEFIMPILYPTAGKIARAQQIALGNNETLVIKESFRPRSVQLFINEQMTQLAKENEQVSQGLQEEPWTMHWFIHSGISNHQRGVAVDLTLAQVEEIQEETIGDFLILSILRYTEYEMHTPVFELSTASVMLEWPVAARDRTAWQQVPVREVVSEYAVHLREIMFAADMIPIASEWWHFNDIDMLEEHENEMGNGDFYLEKLFNRVPTLEGIN